MKISTATRKSHHYNEDRIIIGKTFCMVCDGATELIKSSMKPTGGSWLVSFIKKNLKKNSADVIGELNEISKKAYLEFVRTEGEKTNKAALPSAGIALAEFLGDKVRISTIADCEAVVITKDGGIIRHIIPDLPQLDSMALAEMVKTSRQKGIPVKEAVEYCRDILIKNRQMMNKKDGYAVFTIDKNPDFAFVTAEYDISDIKELYLYTDGITQAFDELKIYSSCEEMFENGIDLNEEITKIKRQAYADKSCNAYPRFKTIDDIAAVKIEFN